jgi:uncharacterized protein YgiM (DUF1202 family)
MLRLSAMLCVGMFAVLAIAGEDRGQMRPGLAKAAAEGRLVVNVASTETTIKAVQPVAEALPVIEVADAPVIQQDAEVIQAAYNEPETTPVAPVRRTVAAPVFTLSALPTESLRETEAAAEEPATQTASEGQVLYVSAKSVNVRQGPSTDSSVVGKLGRGEAALVLWQEGDDWARIIIEGDGLEGYVATRFLSATAP